MFLPVHFGYSAIGEIVKDLAGSNLIIAGHPEAGKSNFLHGLIYGLLLSSKYNYPVWPVIIDLKRLEYGYLEDHALIVTEIDQARETLQAINSRLNERLKTLEAVRPKVVKIQTYLKRGYQMPFILVVIDELAELQDEECQTLLNRILRLGRAVGINVVAATQRPSSTMMKAFGDSKAMFAATMCFHVRDAINSRMLLDNDRAALIPVVKGRAIYQWDKELEVQIMYFPVEEDAKLAKLMKEIEGCTKPGEMVFNDKRSAKRLPPR
jgi:DNA segregation ATPase FtsK/SpoIIIE, S-DNA-T family